jgi:hypothetical protein
MLFSFEMNFSRAPSAGRFLGAAGIVVVYFSDWELICKRIPFYNAKFIKE